MARLFKNESPLERRLKELQEQQQLVRKDIKSLSRALKNPDELTGLPRLKSMPLAGPPRPPAPAERAAAQASRSAGERSAGAPGARSAEDEDAPDTHSESRRRPHPVAKDSRFANYFTVGSVNGLRPLRLEKSVQRNKAIFMVVIVVVVAFVVYRLMR